jgi:YbbR domain-containing protein
LSLQIVRNNFGLKVLAFCLALVGWAYFRFASSSIVASQPFQQLSIPIATANLPLGYVARFVDHEAVVTVATERGQPAVKPEQIKAVLDLTNKGTGVYNVPVQLVAPDVVVQSLSPASVTLTIEKIEQRSFPITMHYVGALPSGIVVSEMEILPKAALVRAPTSLLAQVSAVHADVALPSQPKGVDEMVRPIAVDSSGTELSGLTVAPNLVRVQVRFIAGAAPVK